MILAMGTSELTLVVILILLGVAYYVVLGHSARVSGRPWGWFSVAHEDLDLRNAKEPQEPLQTAQSNASEPPGVARETHDADLDSTVKSPEVIRWETEGGALPRNDRDETN